MRWRWLAGPTGADRVTVVFGGWAAGAAPLAHLRGPGDVLFVEDWRSLDAALPDLSGYRRRVAVCWSFGVAAFAHWQAGQALAFDRQIAICGSPVPVDRHLGIPPAMFRRTRDGLSTTSVAQFLHRIDAPAVPAADIDALRAELDAVASRGAAPSIDWDHALIGAADPIFPAANLARVFAQVPVTRIAAGHTPFGPWRDWDDAP